MKITVVGAVLIVAGVVIALMVLDSLSNQTNRGIEPNNPH